MTRVQFREGQVLHAADLNDESTYLLSLRRRHDAGLHGWGIASGLRLEIEPGGFVVNPGFAWDGYGRALIVQQEIYRPWQLPAGLGGAQQNLFEHLGSSAVDVWLLYNLRPLSDNGNCRDRQPTRWQETTRLCFTPADYVEGEHPDFNPRQPWGVPPADLQFSAHEELKDDPAHVWPVYLGTLVNNPYRIDDTRRPYASLTGQSVFSASRQQQPEDPEDDKEPPYVHRAEMILDGESARPRPHRFAVRVADENGTMIERLVVERPGPAILRGNTTLFSDRPIAQRTDASDWFIAEYDPAFTLDDLCNPEAVLCKTAELATVALPYTGPAELEIPAEDPQAALFFLNNLLLQPDLHQEPLLVNIAKRPITENLIALTQLQVVNVDMHFASFNMAMMETGQATQAEIVRNRFLLEDFLGADICRRRPERAYTLGFNPLAEVPQEALPWSVYRADVPADEETGEPARVQLRFEFNEFGEKEHPERSQFVIGYFDLPEPPKFRPCLSIDESCTVRIEGDLNVDGDVVQRPPPLPPGGPGLPGLPGSPGLSQPTFEEALEAQPVAPSTLDVTVQGFTPEDQTEWPYDIRIENTGGQTLRWVVVLENFSIDGDPPTDTRIAGGLAELVPGDSGIVPITHSGDLPPGANEVTIQITVMAFTPSGAVMYESLSSDALVVP